MQIKKSVAAPISIESKQDEKAFFSDATGNYILYSIPWDSSCEQVRWALDRHKANYVDIDLPWGIQLWETLTITGKSKPCLPSLSSLPLLINQKAEKFDSVTQITMFLYAQAFSGNIRLYSSVKALEEQEFFDTSLRMAATTIYLDCILRDKKLARKYIIQANHLKTWQAINDASWKLMQWVYWIYFKLYDKNTIKVAWDQVHKAFDRVEKLKSENPDSDFLIGSSITAADISFASHAALLLLPQNSSLTLPSSAEMTQEFHRATALLKASVAGKWALKLYEKERGPLLAKKMDNLASEFNPDWADRPSKLRANVFIQLMHILVAGSLPLLVEFDWSLTFLYWIAIIYVMAQFYPKAQEVIKIVYLELGLGLGFPNPLKNE
jgi:hypothetical protein